MISKYLLVDDCLYKIDDIIKVLLQYFALQGNDLTYFNIYVFQYQ